MKENVTRRNLLATAGVAAYDEAANPPVVTKFVDGKSRRVPPKHPITVLDVNRRCGPGNTVSPIPVLLVIFLFQPTQFSVQSSGEII